MVPTGRAYRGVGTCIIPTVHFETWPDLITSPPTLAERALLPHLVNSNLCDSETPYFFKASCFVDLFVCKPVRLYRLHCTCSFSTAERVSESRSITGHMHCVLGRSEPQDLRSAFDY